jgi:hypothetical protein
MFSASLGFIKKKVRRRKAKTPRFFGEAFVASRDPHRDAYYGSVKWLTDRRFGAKRELTDPDHERMRQASHRYFGQPRIEKLQRAVAALASGG